MIITPYFSPEIGGLENYALKIALGLKQAGNDIVVVTSKSVGKRVEETANGLRVIRLPRLFKISNTPISPLWRWQLRKLMNAENPDVINAHTPVPYIADMAARAAGKRPFALTYHNDLAKNSLGGNILASLFYLLYTRRTLKLSNKIIATSKYYATHSAYLKKYNSKIETVAPGIDTRRFNMQVDKTWLKHKYPGKSLILFVGNMQKTHTYKGVEILLQGLAAVKKRIPSIHLVAVGKGNAISGYTRLAESLGVSNNVTFCGYVEDDDLPRYFAGADVFVLASTNKSEGFGMVLLEAMACGTKVIGTDVGGIPNVIATYDDAMLIPPCDVSSLAHAITKQLQRRAKTPLSNKFRKPLLQDVDWKDAAAKTYGVLHSIGSK